jgi:hypothetical protein
MRNDGTDFEKRSADRLSELGWECSHTPTSGDFGADLICKCGNETLVVQCKDYSDGNSIGVAAVQETIAAKLHFRADVALLLFQGRVTQQGRKLANSVGVELSHILDLRSGWVFDRTKKGAAIRRERELELQAAERSRIEEIKKREFSDYKSGLEKYKLEIIDEFDIIRPLLLFFVGISSFSMSFIMPIIGIPIFIGTIFVALKERPQPEKPTAPKWMTVNQVREAHKAVGLDYQGIQRGELSPATAPPPSSPMRPAMPPSPPPPSPPPPPNNTQRSYTKIGTTDSSGASTPDVWKCLRCSKNLNLKHKIGIFQIKCPSCHASYLYDRVSHKSPPTITEKW